MSNINRSEAITIELVKLMRHVVRHELATASDLTQKWKDLQAVEIQFQDALYDYMSDVDSSINSKP